MGIFSGDDSSNSSALIDEQLKQNKAEIENKRQNLTRTRLDIIKSQGQQVWSPDRSAPGATAGAPPSMGTLGGVANRFK